MKRVAVEMFNESLEYGRAKSIPAACAASEGFYDEVGAGEVRLAEN